MFDTLKFARALRDGGQFTPEQSERLSDAPSEVISGEVAARTDLEALESKLGRKIDDLEGKLDRRIDDLEGKLDRGLKEVRADLKTEIKGVQAEIKGVEAKIEAAKTDTLKWIVGIIGFQSVAIIGAAIVLARILAR